MNHSKAWIFVVLLSFIGLILPKDLWHHCDNMHLNISQHDHKSTHFSKDTSCAVCDFHFFPAVENLWSAFTFSKISHPTFDLLLNDFSLSTVLYVFLRGPPKCLIEA